MNTPSVPVNTPEVSTAGEPPVVETLDVFTISDRHLLNNFRRRISLNLCDARDKLELPVSLQTQYNLYQIVLSTPQDENRFWTSCFLLCCFTNMEPHTYCSVSHHHLTPSNITSKLTTLPRHNARPIATSLHF